MKEFPYTWTNCPGHKWKVPIDPLSDGEVYCTECGMPGDMDWKTGEVYYPAT